MVMCERLVTDYFGSTGKLSVVDSDGVNITQIS